MALCIISGSAMNPMYYEKELVSIMKEKGSYTTVDEYIALHPPSIRAGLELLRKTIKKAAPEAE